MGGALNKLCLLFCALCAVSFVLAEASIADPAGTALRNISATAPTASNLCLGVKVDDQKEDQRAMLASCEDQHYTKWIFLPDGTIRNAELQTCLSVVNVPVETHGSDNPESGSKWLAILSPCALAQVPHEGWTALPGGRIKNNVELQCMSETQAWAIHSAIILEECGSVGTEWSTAK
jgi:hypothetical protein